MLPCFLCGSGLICAHREDDLVPHWLGMGGKRATSPAARNADMPQRMVFAKRQILANRKRRRAQAGVTSEDAWARKQG